MGILNETFTMANGLTIPKLGFGTSRASNDEAALSVRTALELGYTHIDTGRVYGNESGVGQGWHDSGLRRDQVFLSTKVTAEFKTYDEAKRSIEDSLSALNTSYVDLLLINAPRPWAEMDSLDAPRYFEENLEVWRAMEEAVTRGDVRSIGVSNFQIDDLVNITDHCTIQPQVNQIRFHIGHTQTDLVAYCHAHGIVVEAYSPIAKGKLLDNSQITDVAKRCGKTVAQICIRYALLKGTLPLPKSTHREFIASNTEVDFEISVADLAILDAVVWG